MDRSTGPWSARSWRSAVEINTNGRRSGFLAWRAAGQDWACGTSARCRCLHCGLRRGAQRDRRQLTVRPPAGVTAGPSGIWCHRLMAGGRRVMFRVLLAPATNCSQRRFEVGHSVPDVRPSFIRPDALGAQGSACRRFRIAEEPGHDGDIVGGPGMALRHGIRGRRFGQDPETLLVATRSRPGLLGLPVGVPSGRLTGSTPTRPLPAGATLRASVRAHPEATPSLPA